MKKSKDYKKSKYFKYAALFFAIASLVFGSFAWLKSREEQQANTPVYDSEEITIEHNGKEYVLKEDVETMLVIGLDKNLEAVSEETYNSTQRADFLMLLVFDNNLKKCSAIQINRDTMTNVNVLDLSGNKINGLTKQIALAPTYGNSSGVSCRNTMDAVSEFLLDTKINHYVSLTLESVPIINDLVGGVEVTVLHDFSGVDNTLVKGQNVTLKGEQALKYVQTRLGLDENDNISRMERQRQYLDAFYEKARQQLQNKEDFIETFFDELSKNIGSEKIIDSDRSVTQLQKLAEKFTEYEFAGILDIEGESKVGEEFMEFYADTDSVKKLVIENFYTAKK